MEESPTVGALRLPPNLDLTAAAALRRDLLDRRGAPVSLDGADVERLGGLCLQVLLAAQASWRADGVPFAFIAASEALRDAAGAMGAEALLGAANEETIL